MYARMKSRVKVGLLFHQRGDLVQCLLVLEYAKAHDFTVLLRLTFVNIEVNSPESQEKGKI